MVVIVVAARLGATFITLWINRRLVSPVNAVTSSDRIHRHRRESYKSMHTGLIDMGSIETKGDSHHLDLSKAVTPHALMACPEADILALPGIRQRGVS